MGTRTLHEYDGEHHRTRAGHTSDLRRERRLSSAGWTRHGYTAHDLLYRAVGVLRDADQAIGREHDPGRIRPWHALLSDSLFTPRGMTAFRRRLKLGASTDREC